MSNPVKRSFSHQIWQSVSTGSFRRGNSHADQAIRMIFSFALFAIAAAAIVFWAPHALAPAGYILLGTAVLGAIGSGLYLRHRYYKGQTAL